MKAITVLILSIFSCLHSFSSDNTISTEIINVTVNKKTKNQLKPRSLHETDEVPVECWYLNGQISLTTDGSVTLTALKLTDIATGQTDNIIIPPASTNYSCQIGNSSVIIEITVNSGDVYEGLLIID